MNQKVLYSVMGLAAMPMVQTVAQNQNWSGTTMTVAPNQVVSDASTAEPLSFNIGKLAPGFYNLSCNLTSKVYDVTVKVTGAKAEAKQVCNNPRTNAQDVNIAFQVVDDTKDIVISFESSDPGVSGAGYSFTALEVGLSFDFATVKTTLSNNAQALANTISGYNYAAKQEDVDAANALKTKAENVKSSYDDYKKYKLYANPNEIQKEINALAESAAAKEAVYQNEQAYGRVNAEITAIKAKYNAAVAELEETLVGVAAYLLDGALDKLNTDINLKITEATKASYDSYQAGTAVADEATNKGLIPTEGELNAIVNDYKTQATNNINAYNALHARVTALQAQLDAIVPVAAIASLFPKTEPQNAINAVNTKVEGAKNSAAQLTLNIDAEETAAQGKITEYKNKVDKANAEYTANKATTTAIAAVQKKLDDAKTAVNAKVSKDGQYKAQDYYAKYVEDVQKEINTLTTDAGKAYKADGTGTAQDYNAGLKAKTDAIEAEITAYQTNAIAAVNHYDDLQAAIGGYQTALDAARAQVEGLAVYTDDNYDYKMQFDLIQKRINDIKKAIEAAQEKVGEQHWTAMIAIVEDAAITTDIAVLLSSVQSNQNEYDANTLAEGIATLDSKITAFYADAADDKKFGDDFATFAAAEGEIETAFNDIVAAKNAINAISETVDYTGEVGTTADKWKLDAVNHSGGENRNLSSGGYTAVEQWGNSAQTGTTLVQTVTGLPNGKYTVELYAFAAQGGTAGSEEFVHVFANGKKTPVKVAAGNPQNFAAILEAENGFNAYTIKDVVVSDGTLQMGLAKDKGGTQWHGIQIKSLKANTASLIQGWGAEVAELNAQQTALETVANDVAAKVTKNSTDKARTQTNIDNLQTEMDTFETTYLSGPDGNVLGLSGEAPDGAVRKEVDAINADLATLEGKNAGVDVTAFTSVDKTTDELTDKGKWHNGEVPSNAGNNLVVNNMPVYEQWGYSANTGTVIVQTINNLPNGVYKLEVYAFASQGNANPGSTENVHVFANGKTTPVKVSGKKGDGNWPGNANELLQVDNGFDVYAIDNVLVSDGTMEVGLTKDKGGTQWHGIRIKSLTYHENTNADLAKYNSDYVALANRKATLDKAAPEIKAAVKANADTKVAADNAVTDLQATELATLKSLKNVTNDNAVSDDATALKADPANWKVFETGLDADKSYTAKKAAIDADIAAMSAAIAASAAAEKLTTDWKNNDNITVVTGKDKDNKDITKTYSIATLTVSINALKAEAEAESANWEAYKDLEDNNMSKLLPDTITVDPADMGAGAVAYYQGLKNSYIAGKATILTNMQKSLNDRKAGADKSTFEGQITDLINKVKVVKSDGIANKKKYDEQVKAYTETQTLWNNTYTEIAATDHSSQVQSWLDQLDAIQVTLTAATEAVEANYPKGESVAKAQDFAAIKAAINDVKAQQNEGYNAAVAADNKAAHESFMGTETTDGTIDLATKAYQRAVQERAKYSSTNDEIADAVNAAAATLDEILYDCPTEIEDLTKDENKAYEETVSPTVFDVSDFNTQAKQIEQKITNALNDFRTDVTAAIGTYWAGKTAGYEAKVAAAEADIADYKDEAKADAFKDVQDLINQGTAAVAAMNLAGVESAIVGLEDIDEMLDADRNAAAKTDITMRIAEADAKYSEVKSYIEGVKIADDPNGTKNQALNNLNTSYNSNVKNYAKKLAKNFDNRDDIKTAVDDFLTVANTSKTAVENLVASDVNNTTAYNEMIAVVEPIEAKLAEAEAAAAPYKYATSFAAEEDELAQLYGEVEDSKTWAYAVGYQAGNFDLDVADLNDHIEWTLVVAFGTEQAGLADDITELKNQYNAYVAVNGLDAKANEFKAAIDDYEAQLAAIAIVDFDDDDPADGLQFDELLAATEALIALQNSIADLETELLEANANTANADVLADFTAQLDDLAATASLEGIDPWVGNQTVGGKKISEWISEISTQIDELQSAINDEPNLSFYKDQYQGEITAIADALEPVADAIEEYQVQCEANDAAYAKLTDEINELQSQIDAALAKVGAYEYAYDSHKKEIVEYDNKGKLIGGAQKVLNDAKAYIDNHNSNKQLDKNSVVPNKADIESTVQDYLDKSAYKELTEQKKALNDALTAAIDVYQAQTYSSKLWANLIAINDEIDDSISELDDAIKYSHNHQYWNGDDWDWGCFDDEDFETHMQAVELIQEDIDDLKDMVDNMGLLGDADENGKVNVIDYQKVVNMILDPTLQPEEDTNLFANIDINKNEVVEVGDLTAIVNYILSGEWADGYAAVKSFNFSGSSENLTMSVVEMQNGVQRFAVNLQNNEDYTAFQLDMVLPEGMTIVDATLSERAGESHKLYSRAQQDGSVRLLASSITGESFSGNEGAVLYIDVQTNANFKGGNVELMNILFSDVYAQTRAFSVGAEGQATGIDIMATIESLKQKVYDLSGRVMNGMKKGINIIQGADGSTKKVLK